MGRGENGRHHREAQFIRSNRSRLHDKFLKREYSERAIEWKVDERIYRHIVDEVTQLDERGIERALRRYAAARVTINDGALELKRQLLLEIQMFASGDAPLDD